jgi:CRP-like cAMP-binding protein
VRNFISPPGTSRQNRLLAALPDADWDRLQCNLKPVFMPLGSELHRPGVPQDRLYFPATALVSLQNGFADGTCAEIAMVGREGVIGIALVMGGGISFSRAVVDRPGLGYFLNRRTLKEEFGHGGALLRLLLRYTLAQITQIAQTAVCNRHHPVHQQLCRWLLERLDRLDSGGLIATHEIIAQRLCVRRESVSAAASDLQQAGLISYRRGEISVADRQGLEELCWECYAVVREETDRLLPIPDRFVSRYEMRPCVRQRTD